MNGEDLETMGRLLCPSEHAPSLRRNARSGDPTFCLFSEPDMRLPRPPVVRTGAQVREPVPI